MSDESKPDFAMLRAAEILAQMHEHVRRRVNEPAPALDRPVVLRSERLTLEVRKTMREDVEKELGVAFSYPARGWHTYATKESTAHCLLSLFYRRASLVAVELYVPRSERAPALEPHDLGGLRFDPGGIAVGMPADSITQVFMPAVGGPGNIFYERAFEARFPGGVAYAMARRDSIERLTLYADIPKDAA